MSCPRCLVCTLPDVRHPCGRATPLILVCSLSFSPVPPEYHRLRVFSVSSCSCIASPPSPSRSSSVHPRFSKRCCIHRQHRNWSSWQCAAASLPSAERAVDRQQPRTKGTSRQALPGREQGRASLRVLSLPPFPARIVRHSAALCARSRLLRSSLPLLMPVLVVFLSQALKAKCEREARRFPKIGLRAMRKVCASWSGSGSCRSSPFRSGTTGPGLQPRVSSIGAVLPAPAMGLSSNLPELFFFLPVYFGLSRLPRFRR